MILHISKVAAPFCVKLHKELHRLAQRTSSPTTTWPALLVLRAANAHVRLCKVSFTGFGQR